VLVQLFITAGRCHDCGYAATFRGPLLFGPELEGAPDADPLEDGSGLVSASAELRLETPRGADELPGSEPNEEQAHTENEAAPGPQKATIKPPEETAGGVSRASSTASGRLWISAIAATMTVLALVVGISWWSSRSGDAESLPNDAGLPAIPLDVDAAPAVRPGTNTARRGSTNDDGPTEFRRWRSDDGREIYARLKTADEQHLTFEKEDGQIVTLSSEALEMFSAEDQEYIRAKMVKPPE
jgi:hypothetical protein